MKPITRKEYYLAKAAGTYTGPTPPPVLREDYYLATLAGDYSGYCPATTVSNGAGTWMKVGYKANP